MIYRRRGVVLGHSSEVASKIAAQQCQTRINEFEPSKVLTPLDFTSALLNRGEKLLLYKERFAMNGLPEPILLPDRRLMTD
jgi:hypothetical protein